MLKARAWKWYSVVPTGRHLSTNAARAEEYSEEAKYPEILDLSFEAKRYRKKQVFAAKVQSLNTVEEKMMALNMKKYYGFKCVMLNDHRFPYNSLPLVQYATRTKLHETTNQLPEFYRKNDEKVQTIAGSLKSAIEDAIHFELECYRQSEDLKSTALTTRERTDIMSSALIQQIHRVLVNNLRDQHEHLREVDVDIDPKHEGFWLVGGIEPLTIVQKIRDGVEWQKKHKMDPTDRPFQYLGSPHLAMRHRHPLSPIAPVLETPPSEKPIDIPTFKLDPRSLGFQCAYRHGSTAPGIWPGIPEVFGLVAFQRRSGFTDRNPKYGAEDQQEALHAQGIASLFGWLLGQACYQGFTPYNDLTYPLYSQSITTDGQFWSFYGYQLNTIVLHSHWAEQSPRANECWATKEMRLYETIDDQGRLQGFNEDVMKNLVHFYVNAPSERKGVDMQPYLNANERYIGEISDEEKREWLRCNYRHLITNKPRHKLIYEIYNWEKIYMVDHNTRPLMARRRPFQLRQNPFDKPLDGHSSKYIPKSLRPDGPKSKKKRVTTYYPKVH